MGFWGKNPFLASLIVSGACQQSSTCSHIAPMSASVFTWPSPLCISVSSHIAFLSWYQTLDLQPTLIEYDLILNNYIYKDPVSSKITFWIDMKNNMAFCYGKWIYCIQSRHTPWEFPGSSMARIPDSTAGGMGSIPGQGIKILEATQPKRKKIDIPQSTLNWVFLIYFTFIIFHIFSYSCTYTLPCYVMVWAVL